MKRVLVLDANQRSALAVTRSLGHHGVPVVAADDTATALAGCSRFSQKYVVYPSPQTRAGEFITKLIELIDAHKINIILPMTELTTELLLQHRDRFPGVIFPCPELSAINSLANKCSLMRLAQSLSVPVPRTWFIEKPDDLPTNLADLPYPLVLKPGKSWLQVEGKWIRAAVLFATGPAAVHSFIKSEPGLRSQPFMLQECIDGQGAGVFALYDHGTPIVFFSHRRLREKPPWGGVSVLSESTPVDPALLGHAKALLDSVAWHGIAMVEFKVTADGVPYLMEINTRFWGSLQLAVDAGVDFPWMVYQLACDEPIAPVTRYKTGRRLRWLLGDLDSLYLSLKDRKTSLARKLSAIGQFLLSAPWRTRHEVNRWEDLGPFWWELKRYVRDILG